MTVSFIPAYMLGIPSFMASLKALLSLTPDQMRQFRSLLEQQEDVSYNDSLVTRAADALSVKIGTVSEIVRVYDFLYQRASSVEDFRALANDLAQLAEEQGLSTDGKAEALQTLVAPIPVVDRANVIRGTLQSLMPILQGWSFHCELRAVSDPVGNLKGYIPVVAARFDFDEPIAGQAGIAFQIPDEALASLAGEISRIQLLLSQVKDREAKQPFGEKVK